MIIKTESQKLRDRIGLTDSALADYCLANEIPFECDGDGTPWLAHATLIMVLESLPQSHQESPLV